MDNTNSMTLTDTGLAPGYDDAPATFGAVGAGGLAAAAPQVCSGLHSAVNMCGMLYGIMADSAAKVRMHVRMHLLAKLNLACVLLQLQKQCARAGVAYGALFEGYKGSPAARAEALEASGSEGLPFTYATAYNYVKALKEVEKRMQEAGGLTPAVVAATVCEHAEQLLTGGYDDWGEATEAMWTPWVTEKSLREMHLALAPAKPEASDGEKLDAARNAYDEEPRSLETLRADFLTRCWGYCDSFSGYVESMAARVTAQERETVAARLEEIAARIRATKTRPAAAAALPNA